MFNILLAIFTAYCSCKILLMPNLDNFTYWIFFSIIFVYSYKILDIESELDKNRKNKWKK